MFGLTGPNNGSDATGSIDSGDAMEGDKKDDFFEDKQKIYNIRSNKI